MRAGRIKTTQARHSKGKVNMKNKITGLIVLALSLSLVGGTALAKDQYVKGHTKKDGTYVEGHYKTKANGTKDDNYSTKGNTNPYNGKKGTKNPNK
jgi:hypothetical protein